MGDKNAVHWGHDQGTFLAGLRDKPVAVCFLDGKGIKGTLVGVDPYNIFVQLSDKDVTILKHAIRYVHGLGDASQKRPETGSG